jgi:hypothetical protein
LHGSRRDLFNVAEARFAAMLWHTPHCLDNTFAASACLLISPHTVKSLVFFAELYGLLIRSSK